MNRMKNIYLDDVRTPIEEGWLVVRNYDEFVSAVNTIGLENISVISFDHDLGESAMQEYFNNVSPNYCLNYDNITERTGYDCAKFIVNKYYDENPGRITADYEEKVKKGFDFPQIYVHSANPIGSSNIMGYINNFLMNERQPQTCVRVNIAHTIGDDDF